MADGFDACVIGTQVANVIMGFVAMVSAVGMAAITMILGNPRLQNGLEHDQICQIIGVKKEGRVNGLSCRHELF